MYIIYAIIRVENNQERETYKPQVKVPDECSINTMWKLYFNFLFPVLFHIFHEFEDLKFRKNIGDKTTF